MEAALEDEGVEDGLDGGLVLGRELVDGLEAFEELAVGDGDAWALVLPILESKVVERDVEELGDADEQVGLGDVETALVAGDLLLVDIEALGELGLGPAAILAKTPEALAEGLGDTVLGHHCHEA